LAARPLLSVSADRGLARPKPVCASSLEAYGELEKTLYLLRDALEAAETHELFLEELKARHIPEDRVRQVADLNIGGDLHLHSTASDGKLPARKLPWLAQALGLKTIAITDHDSIEGCREAFREGMLVGVQVLPGLELSTEHPGLEILAYFADTGRFFNFLASSKSLRFREVLARRQDEIHRRSLACLDHVNGWLRRQKVPAEKLITLEEYDCWFGGQKPYFPGTLCVLGLERLSEAERQRLKIRDPRMFNTRIVTPFLQQYEMKEPLPKGKGGRPASLLDEAFAILKTVRRAGVPVVTFLAHPKELVTKGRMSLGAVRKLVGHLAEGYGLDGLEVACARDTEDDTRYWNEILRDYNASLPPGGDQGPHKRLLAASHSSDFHVLGPGLSTGEITIGFGVLDSRPEFRRGNLRPQMSLEEFLEQFQQRACEGMQL
jgi:predicted metal-dependent phosphoesterase TrpH